MKQIQTSDIYKATAVAAIAITAMLAAPAFAQSKVLTDKAGMTVYTFDNDAAGKSACYGECAAVWPPVRGNIVSDADLTIMSRNDGTQQVAFKGKPLYLFVGDRKPGDMTGDKMQSVWHVVHPAGASTAFSAPRTVYSAPTSSSY